MRGLFFHLPRIYRDGTFEAVFRRYGVFADACKRAQRQRSSACHNPSSHKSHQTDGTKGGRQMMHELVTTNRAAIIANTTEAARLRSSPIATGLVENGVPRFLSQLSQALLFDGRGGSTSDLRDVAIGESASRYGGELLALGFTVSQVVGAYGDICQAVTEIANAQKAPISVDEFQILNRCLDAAIAGALTEHARLTALKNVASVPPRLRGLLCPACHAAIEGALPPPPQNQIRKARTGSLQGSASIQPSRRSLARMTSARSIAPLHSMKSSASSIASSIHQMNVVCNLRGTISACAVRSARRNRQITVGWV
jgi:hypothetical protein